MYYLVAFAEGYEQGNVWEEGPIERIAATATSVFGAYGFTSEKIGDLINGEKVYLAENPYGDYIQAFRRHHMN